MAVVISLSACAQEVPAWTWLGGSNINNQTGVYGTQGKPDPGNIPSSRWGSVDWLDKDGNLWLFGGFTGALMNDLWEYNPSQNVWTWMGGGSTVGGCTTVQGISVCSGQPGVYGSLGVPAPGNMPGARADAVSWTDGTGNLWLFGGSGPDANGDGGDLNDLWEYTPGTAAWTWMGGSSTLNGSDPQPGIYGTKGVPAAGNIPGGRDSAMSWVDADGNLWLLGGQSHPTTTPVVFENDLWEYSPVTHQWTWVGGSNTGNQSGVYGTRGEPADGNVPGGRAGAGVRIDAEGNLWLFGGAGLDQNGTNTLLNDLWEYGASSRQWAWMGGSSASVGCTTYLTGLVQCAGQSGVYGVPGTPDPANIPGGRAGAATWIDPAGHLWLFGGGGYDAAGNQGYLNDLWEYDPASSSWTWMAGNAIESESGCAITPEGVPLCVGLPGVYGTLGLPGPGNDPGARISPLSWTDRSGDLLLFGGYGLGRTNTMGGLNDLWEFQESSTALPPTATPTFSPASGTYSTGQTVTISDATPGATIYYTSDGSAPDSSSTEYTGPIVIPGDSNLSREFHAIAMADGYSPSAMADAGYNIVLPPNFSLASSPGSVTVRAGESGTVAITVTPLNRFTSAVSFACSGLPAGVSCSFSPESVAPEGNPASTTLTLTATSAAVAGRRSGPLLSAAALAGVFCCIGCMRRRMESLLVLIAVCGLSLSLLSGCGSSHSPPTTVTVTATSGSFSQSTSFSLTVR